MTSSNHDCVRECNLFYILYSFSSQRDSDHTQITLLSVACNAPYGINELPILLMLQSSVSYGINLPSGRPYACFTPLQYKEAIVDIDACSFYTFFKI